MGRTAYFCPSGHNELQLKQPGELPIGPLGRGKLSSESGQRRTPQSVRSDPGPLYEALKPAMTLSIAATAISRRSPAGQLSMMACFRTSSVSTSSLTSSGRSSSTVAFAFRPKAENLGACLVGGTGIRASGGAAAAGGFLTSDLARLTELLDDRVAFVLLDDGFELGEHVTMLDREADGRRADGLVFHDRELERLDAVDVRAFAEELRVGRFANDRFDVLVDRADERLVLCALDGVIVSLQHRESPSVIDQYSPGKRL